MTEEAFAVIEVRSMTIFGVGGFRHVAMTDAVEAGAEIDDDHGNVYQHPSEADLARLRAEGGFAVLPCDREVLDEVLEVGGAYEDVSTAIVDGRIVRGSD